MSNPHLPTFVPHTSEDDLGFSGAWRPMLAHSVTERGIKIQVLGKQSKDDGISGVLMPSFDWGISPFDPAFVNSVAAHMSKQPDPKKTVHFLPNPWATPWKCYTFQGPMNEHFISPSNRAKMIGGSPDMDKELIADAFDDIYLFIKRNPKLDKQAKDYYLAKPDMNTDARVPLVERKYFGNFLVRDKERKSDTHVVLCFTGAAYNYLIEQMRWATRFGTQPVDQEWPAYLIGDPTNPAGSLVWHQEKMTVGGLKMESNVMCFTSQPEQMDNNPERRAISPAQLAGRLNLYDPNVWNWPTYQEMVDFALEHWTEVPRDLIADACGHRATVGQRSKKSEVFDGGGSPVGGGVGGVGGVGAAPPQSAVAYQDPNPVQQQPAAIQPPPAVQTPPAQAAPQPAQAAPQPAAEEQMWVSGPATGSAVVKWPVSKIREFAASGQLTSEQINVNGAWQSFAAAGFPAPAAPAQPAAPAAPAEPAPPAAPAAPSAPAIPAAPAQGNPPDSALQAEIDKLVPMYGSMTPDKQERVRQVVAAIMAHATTNPGSPVPQNLSLELGNILMS
jgi:hypothetical protein